MTACISPSCKEPRTIGALFCDVHMKAPPAQRGGWISAEKRRRALGNQEEEAMDASNITTRLWIGSKPPFDRDLPAFDVIVLCAQELQPDRLAFARKALRVPLPDSALNSDELRRAVMGGKEVAKGLRSGKRVLVTCAAGLNRSALVASLGLGMATTLSADQIIELVRARRGSYALHNPHFVEYIKRVVGVGRSRDAVVRR